MRLVNTSTLEMEEFMGDYAGRYSILSHTWEKDEITMQEFLMASDTKDTRRADQLKLKPGYIKIQKAAEVASNLGFNYIWIDTCCIDKKSSAELSEAINSMYRWYKKAALCIAYLADVESASNREQFEASKWFTRGWTLQELVAPVNLSFYSATWKLISLKSAISLRLSVITGIDREVLQSPDADLSALCIARRMSWASKRSTTRVEDMAYCLLGLFDVNMPLLYGEGEKAFQRLQEEIVKKSDDQTLFAWKQKLTAAEMDESYCMHRGLFARSPSEFADFADDARRRFARNGRSVFTGPSAITNIGLQTRLPLIPADEAMSLVTQPRVDTFDTKGEYLALLNHQAIGALNKHRVYRYAIHLKQLIKGQPVYIRVRPDITYAVLERDTPEHTSEVVIQETPRIYMPYYTFRFQGFYISLDARSYTYPHTSTLYTPSGMPTEIDTSKASVLLPISQERRYLSGAHGTLLRTYNGKVPVLIAFGIDLDTSAPMVCAYRMAPTEDPETVDMADAKRKATNFCRSALQDAFEWTFRDSWYEPFSLSLSPRIIDDKLVYYVEIKTIISSTINYI